MRETTTTAITMILLAAAALAGCGGGSGSGKGFSVLYQTENNVDFDLVPAIFSVRGASAGDVWATGQFGTAVHYTGGHWTKVPTGAMGSLGSLTGLSPTNAFALDVIYGGMYRWNGREWSAASEPSDGRYAIWAESQQSVWGVGRVEDHWDGAAWTPVPSEDGISFFSVFGIDLGSLFAAGANGGVIHFDGSTWRDVPTTTLAFLNGVWASSGSDAWMVGEGGVVLHYNGSTLAMVDVGTQHDLSAITGTGPSDIWIAGDLGTLVHWDGASWAYAVTPNGEPVNSVWSPGPNEVWIADTTGSVVRYRP